MPGEMWRLCRALVVLFGVVLKADVSWCEFRAGVEVWVRAVVCEISEDAAAKEDDGRGEGFVAVEHLLPLFG
jgi:hypothetical protein